MKWLLLNVSSSSKDKQTFNCPKGAGNALCVYVCVCTHASPEL